MVCVSHGTGQMETATSCGNGIEKKKIIGAPVLLQNLIILIIKKQLEVENLILWIQLFCPFPPGSTELCSQNSIDTRTGRHNRYVKACQHKRTLYYRKVSFMHFWHFSLKICQPVVVWLLWVAVLLGILAK